MTQLPDPERMREMLPYDYFSPVVAVKLIPEGASLEEAFPLWQGKGWPDTVAKRIKFEGDNLAMLQEVLIEWQGMFYQMTINLSPTYDDAIKLVNSYLLQQGKTIAVVEMGFRTTGAGAYLQTFYGVVEEIDFSIGTEVSLVLKTVPPPTIAAKQQKSSKKNKQDPWNNKSPLEIIKELWEGKQQQLNRKVEVIPPGDDPGIKLMNEKMDSYTRNSRTDWAVIQSLVEANYCTALADGSVLRINSMKYSIGEQPPVATFHLFSGGVLGGDTNAYPITAASLKTSALFARTLAGTLVVGVDEKTGKVVRKTVGTPDADKSGAKEGAQTKPTASKKPGGGPSPDASEVPEGGARQTQARDPTSKGELNKALAAAMKEWKTQGIELEIESVLIPHLVPHENLDISGFGSRIDGRYWIQKLFFQIGPDGGLTRFDCVRVGVTEGPGQTKPLAGKTNEAPPAESGGKTEKKAEPEGSDPNDPVGPDGDYKSL